MPRAFVTSETKRRATETFFTVAFVTLFSEDSRHNYAHTTPSAMSSDAAHDADTLVSGDITTDMHGPSPQAATPGLLDDIVVTHILRSEYFDDPADLARLQSVSRAMRDAVAATGLRFEVLDKEHAVELGCISAVKRMQW